MGGDSVLSRSMPFLGTYTPRLDDKGRLILPAKFRTQLANGLVLTRGQERCLYLMPLDEFLRINGEMSQAPLSNKRARDFQRVLLSGASDELPDKQGRVSIPPVLREYAGLGRDVAVIGAGTRAEIWDLTAWQQYLASREGDYSDTAEEVFPNGPF